MTLLPLLPLPLLPLPLSLLMAVAVDGAAAITAADCTLDCQLDYRMQCKLQQTVAMRTVTDHTRTLTAPACCLAHCGTRLPVTSPGPTDPRPTTPRPVFSMPAVWCTRLYGSTTSEPTAAGRLCSCGQTRP